MEVVDTYLYVKTVRGVTNLIKKGKSHVEGLTRESVHLGCRANLTTGVQ